MAVREIAGRRFTTEEDYRAGLRDQKKIEEIKNQYNLNNPMQVFELYRQAIPPTVVLATCQN